MEDEIANRLKSLSNILRETLLLVPEAHIRGKETKLNDLFGITCKLVFNDDLYLNIWDENILLQLERLFQVKTPNQEVYGNELKILLNAPRLSGK